MSISNAETTIGPRPELPWLVEPEQERVIMALVAEATVLEMRHIAEPEHEVAIAELEHQTALAGVPEMSRPKPWNVSELGRKTTVAEVPELTRLERPRLPNEATVMELEARVSQVQHRHGVPRELPETEAAVSCLGWLRPIANAATTAPSTIILRIAALPDRASGAAHGVPHQVRRSLSCPRPISLI